MAMIDEYLTSPNPENKYAVSSQQTGIAATLRDPNFISLLAGIGAGLDPTGVGGAIGGATQQLVKARAAQQYLRPSTASKNWHQQMVEKLGGFTPPEVPGVTKTAVKEDGSFNVEITPPVSEQPKPAEQPPTTLPDAVFSTTAVPAEAAPAAVPAAAPVATVPVATTAPGVSTPNRPKVPLRDIIPFY